MTDLADHTHTQKKSSPAGNELLCFVCLKSIRAVETSGGRIPLNLSIVESHVTVGLVNIKTAPSFGTPVGPRPLGITSHAIRNIVGVTGADVGGHL